MARKWTDEWVRELEHPGPGDPERVFYDPTLNKHRLVVKRTKKVFEVQADQPRRFWDNSKRKTFVVQTGDAIDTTIECSRERAAVSLGRIRKGEDPRGRPAERETTLAGAWEEFSKRGDLRKSTLRATSLPTIVASRSGPSQPCGRLLIARAWRGTSTRLSSNREDRPKPITACGCCAPSFVTRQNSTPRCRATVTPAPPSHCVATRNGRARPSPRLPCRPGGGRSRRSVSEARLGQASTSCACGSEPGPASSPEPSGATLLPQLQTSPCAACPPAFWAKTGLLHRS
jgi:hypothetical protein